MLCTAYTAQHHGDNFYCELFSLAAAQGKCVYPVVVEGRGICPLETVPSEQRECAELPVTATTPMSRSVAWMGAPTVTSASGSVHKYW